jgi:hypothetical protein
VTTTLQALQSASLLEPDLENPCVCCGQTHWEGEFCGRCQAPAQLARSVRQRGAPPRFISVLGASGAGKTVYLGMLLDLLTRETTALRGFASGTFSVSLQQDTVAALESRRFPEKTPSEADRWNWVHCQLFKNARAKNPFDIITPDFAGEALQWEADHPGEYPAVFHVVQQSAGILLLCDSLRARDDSVQEDLFCLKLLTYVLSLHSHQPPHKVPPLAVVFTKADCCHEAFDDPEQFAVNSLPRLVHGCHGNVVPHRFFAASVVGSSAPLVDDRGCLFQVPFHVEPRGLVEPLEWLVDTI